MKLLQRFCIVLPFISKTEIYSIFFFISFFLLLFFLCEMTAHFLNGVACDVRKVTWKFINQGVLAGTTSGNLLCIFVLLSEVICLWNFTAKNIFFEQKQTNSQAFPRDSCEFYVNLCVRLQKRIQKLFMPNNRQSVNNHINI